MTETLRVIDPKGVPGRYPGIYYYRSLLGCPRRRLLSKGLPEDPEESADSRVGRWFHALAAPYYTDEPVSMDFTTLEMDPDRTEALRLFEEYRRRFLPTEFGKVLGAEVEFPADDEQQMELEAFFGGPIGGKLDLLVNVGADEVDYLNRTRHVEMTPGIWIVDHKVKRARSGDVVIQAQLDEQFALYAAAWNRLNPDRPVRGTLANIIFKYKKLDDHAFLTIQVPPPTELEIAVVREIIQEGCRIVKEKTRNWANPRVCFEFGRVCPHLISGACNRLNFC